VIEDEPLLLVSLHDVVNSESVLVSTNMLFDSEGLSASHKGSDLELSSISEWLSSQGLTGLIEDPSLVGTVVAVVEDNVSVVSVRLSVDIEALVTVVSDVSDRSVVVSNSDVVRVIELSQNSGVVDSELNSSLVSESEVSSGPGSDGLGSRVVDEPLELVSWMVVSDSSSVLVSSDVLSHEESSVSRHS